MKLLVIADDLTGALDTGIQFAREGVSVRVETGLAGKMHFDFARFSVIVAHSASRHLPAEAAFARVEAITRLGIAAGAELLYKKTDSGLRGRVGAELSALCATADAPLWFVPAYPAMGRVTRGGIHYCAGLPVAESPFGRDPVDPVTVSRVVDLLAQTGDCPAVSLPPGAFPEENDGVAVFDCDADGQMPGILAEGLRRGVRLYAGCAGFAAALAKGLPFSREKAREIPKRSGLFVACGSLHPASVAQVREAIGAGFEEIAPDAEALARLPAVTPGRYAVLHTGNARFPGQSPADVTAAIQSAFARLLPPILADENRYLMVIGGDALEGLLRALAVPRVTPLAALPGGTVLSEIETAEGRFPILTKSGGFGDAGLLTQIREHLCDAKANKV